MPRSAVNDVKDPLLTQSVRIANLKPQLETALKPFRDNHAESLPIYRSRFDIAAAILEVAYRGSNKSTMIYGAYLSHSQLKEYLEELTRGELIRQSELDGLFYATEKGRKFVAIYKELASMLLRRTSNLTEQTPSRFIVDA